jgi:hypothetical protein
MQVRKTEPEVIPHDVVLIEVINSRIVGNLEVSRSVLTIAVDRIQWNFEPMREAGRELF